MFEPPSSTPHVLLLSNKWSETRPLFTQMSWPHHPLLIALMRKMTAKVTKWKYLLCMLIILLWIDFKMLSNKQVSLQLRKMESSYPNDFVYFLRYYTYFYYFMSFWISHHFCVYEHNVMFQRKSLQSSLVKCINAAAKEGFSKQFVLTDEMSFLQKFRLVFRWH